MPFAFLVPAPLNLAAASEGGFVRLSSTDAYEAPWHEGYAASRLLLPHVRLFADAIP